MRNKLINLVKIDLKLCNLTTKLKISSITFLVIIYMISNSLINTSRTYHLNLNIWDGIFKTATYSSLILGFYLPFIAIMTTFLNIKGDYESLIMLRNGDKKTYILSKIITNLILALIYTSIFFGILIIVNMFLFKFELGWSSVITDKEHMQVVVNLLYMNSFIHSLSPIQAVGISFVKLFLTTAIIINLKDLLINYIENKYIPYATLSIYLIINFFYDVFAPQGGILENYEYISLNTLSILYRHKFPGAEYFLIPLHVSIIISIVLLIFIIGINLLLSKRYVITND